MDFCDHCAGQRFDRAQVLRALRATRRDLRLRGRASRVDAALTAAIKTIRDLEIPHLEVIEEPTGNEVVH
jgi:hypothetical protein